MKLTMAVSAFALVAFAPLAHAGAASCTPTGFSYEGISILTAAQINSPGIVSGDVDATGCDIGIYYGPNAYSQVVNANVHGADYFGIVNNGGHVDVLSSAVSEIGDKPFDGDQHGVAIYWADGSAANGNIQGNLIWDYQKAGIVVRGSAATANIQNNTVIGLGPVNFIAQNGIEARLGASTQIQQNLVTGNSYTGPGETSSAGILVYGGPGYGGAATVNTIVQ